MLRWLALAALVMVGCVSAADAQQHDASKNFNTLAAANNTSLTGIWSDGTTMWVADIVDGKIYAYRMSVTPEPILTTTGQTTTGQTTTGQTTTGQTTTGQTTTECWVWVLELAPFEPGECLWTLPYPIHIPTGPSP